MVFSLRKLTLSVRLILPCFTEFRAYSFALSGKKTKFHKQTFYTNARDFCAGCRISFN